MSLLPEYEIKKYVFSNRELVEIEDNPMARGLWPFVYILSANNSDKAYVGETADIFSRLGVHLNDSEKKKLDVVHLISSHLFNKSAALDIESNLIRYLDGDGKYSLLNCVPGMANHNYFQKKRYLEIFKTI